MPKTSTIVIHYDGENYRATLTRTEFPSSSAPHVHGLSNDNQIVATIALENNVSHEDLTVYIEEEEVNLDA
jgi:hypothetical protein